MGGNESFVPRSVEAEGKSIDEAIFKGIQQMKLSIDEVDIQTVQEGSKGLLGLGAKPFIVRLTERDPERFAQEAEREADEKKAGEEVRSRPVIRESHRREARPYRSRERDDRDREFESIEGISRVTEPVPYQPYIPGESDCDGAEFLLGVIERMGLRVSLSFFEDESSIKFRIDSFTHGILIGHRGETLDALQYLVSLVVNKDGGEYRYVQLDTENYRVKREQTLIRLARKSAAKVAQYGRPYVFEPMKPYERRVLHAALADFEGVTTHSEGEDNDRHVVIVATDEE